MKRTFRQQPDGTLLEVTPSRDPDYNNTFQAGDIPDMMKDVERNKADLQKAQKKERLQEIIDIVNRY